MEFPVKINSRFDRLVQIFKIHEEKREKNITFNPIDFRVTGEKEGSGEIQSLALNYFSLFLLMFEAGEYDEIDRIFPINKVEWDIELMKNTLITGVFNQIEIPEKYKNVFKDVESVEKYIQAQYFKNLPHAKLKVLIEETIDKKVQSIASDYLQFKRERKNREILKTKIRAMHLWYMDIPAFCKMMEKIHSRPGLSVGYFGADHVSNLMPLISRIDPFFTVHVASGNLDLPMDIREEILEFV
jgi:hypothetical protein